MGYDGRFHLPERAKLVFKLIRAGVAPVMDHGNLLSGCVHDRAHRKIEFLREKERL